MSIHPDHLFSIAEQFKPQGKITHLQDWGSGNVNDTFLVTLDTPESPHFILQRLNTHVFQQPEWVMDNIHRLTQHIDQRLQINPSEHQERWEVPQVLMTEEGKTCFEDGLGSCWRALGYIEGESVDIIENCDRAEEVGYALGRFHFLLSDFPPDQLADTLDGFHITPRYLQQYDQVMAKESSSKNDSLEVTYCHQFIKDRRAFASVLEDAKEQGKLPLRVIHGDPKVNNVMLDKITGKAISLIDLDTVKPGLIHYDLGDCLRSGCNPLGEETQDWDNVHFDPERAKALLQGYLTLAKGFLTENDYAYIYDSIRLISFELGLRFFTDYLAGSVYFKAKYPEHNLNRAMVQFKLTESIEKQETTLQTLIQSLQ